MNKLYSDVIIKAESYIPVEIKNQAQDWIQIIENNAAFIATFAAVIASAILTYIMTRKSIKSQEDQAIKSRKAEHENKISEFRHLWLQEVRNTASDLIKILYQCQYYKDRMGQLRDWIEEKQTEKVKDSFQKKIDDFRLKEIESKNEYLKLSSKLKLLFKPADENFKELDLLLSGIRDNLESTFTTTENNEKIDKIIEHLKTILKDEWEVTKDRSWIKEFSKN
nr:hypothetical protein [uncultured Desulfobacter sp.]